MPAPCLAGAMVGDGRGARAGALVFTVTDRPGHVGADRAVTALLGAFSFAR